MFVLSSTGQKLTITDLSKLKLLSLNNGETILSQKKFEFKEASDPKENRKDYTFSHNLDKYGDIGDEYLVLSFNEVENKPYLVWYQLPKKGWQILQNTLAGLGYKKIKTEIESDGWLSTIYKKSNLIITFSSGKSSENNGVFAYTLGVSN